VDTTETNDDDITLTIRRHHSKRVTGWTAECSDPEHGLVPSRRTKDHAIKMAQHHASVLHRVEGATLRVLP
jgi:hypothetical protein